MIVAELIKLLQECHPQAVVLIPADPSMGQACEKLADVARIDAGQFPDGPAAQGGVVRLSSFPVDLLISGFDLVEQAGG